MKSSCAWTSPRVALTALSLSFGLGACTSMSPAVPSDVAQNSTPSKVRSSALLVFSDGAFEVGEYRVSRINYGVVQANGVLLGPFSRGASAGAFTFHVGGPRADWTADCSSRSQTDGIGVNRRQLMLEQSHLHCELFSGRRRATLALQGLAENQSGSVRVGNAIYSVRQYVADNREPGKPYIPGPSGLRIDRNGENVAALEFARPGTFWINRTLTAEVQDALIGVLSAMLIEQRRNEA